MTGSTIRVEFDGNVIEYATLDDLLNEAEFLESLADANRLIHSGNPAKGVKVAEEAEYALRYAYAHYEAAARALNDEDGDLEQQIDRINRDLGDSDSTS